MEFSANERSDVIPRSLMLGAGLTALKLMLLAQPAAAQFKAPNNSVNEGKVAVFKITLPRTYKYDVRYRHHTADGTARKGRHYEARRGYVELPRSTGRIVP